MASNRIREKTQSIPSLLDRLTERSPRDVSMATSERGELPEWDIESAILRDLGWLLQSTSLSDTTDLSNWPNVGRSVLNFGVGAFTGRVIRNADAPQIERTIKRAIATFEPRLRRDTLQVQVSTAGDEYDERQIRIWIGGEYVEQGRWLALDLDLSIDKETGRMQIIE